MQTVHELLERKSHSLLCVRPGQSVFEAIELMAEKRVGALLVMQDGALLGVLSERDYARKVILMGRSSQETRVEEIMTSQVITVTPDANVHRCMEIMTEKRIRHLPVVEKDAVIGVLSIGDLVKAVIDAQREEIEQLQRYIAG